MHCPRFNFIRFFTSIAIAIAIIFFFVPVNTSVNAAAGINRQINFQGKLVNNPAATNVTDTSYTVVFTLYDNASGANTALWTETQTVMTTDGIFRVALGSVTPFPANFNFNWDGLYLGVKVGSDAEMTPRIQMAAVPFAFNAGKVAGLTVQDDSGNASTSGTLQIANAKTVKFVDAFTTSNALTFGSGTTGTITLGTSTNTLQLQTTSNTNITLPTSGTLLTNTTALNQTITSTQTTGTVLGITDSTGLSGAITGMAITLSGAGAQDQTGLLFNLSGASSTNVNDIVGTGSSWNVSKAGALTVASCNGCGGVNYWQRNLGALAPVNITDDLLIGSIATPSASATNYFQVFGIGNTGAGTTAGDASMSGTLTLGTNRTVNNTTNPTLSTERNMPFIIGGNTTGSIQLSPKGTTGLYVDPTGNVGIGTTTPKATLDIAGSASLSGNLSFNTNGSELRMYDSYYNYTGFKAPTDLTGTSNYIYTLPSDYGTNGQFISTNGSGGLSWSSGVTPAVDMASCQERNTGTYTLTASFADLTLDTTDVENNTAVCQHDGSNTQRININQTGLYTLHYQADISQGTTVNDYSFQIVKNASTVVNGSLLNGKNSSTDKTIVSANVLVSLTAGDYIRVQVKYPASTGGVVSDLVFSAVRMAGPKGDPGAAGAIAELNGAMVPLNSTEDLLIGGQSTASADFAVLGLASPLHQVTASVSGNLIVMANNGWGGNVGIGTTSPTESLTVNGNIQLMTGNKLSFGDVTAANTGIYFNTISDQSYFIGHDATAWGAGQPLLANSYFGWKFKTALTGASLSIDTGGKVSIGGDGIATALATLDVRPNTSNGGTLAVASVSGKTSFASLIVDNSGLGDIFTASASGAPRFVITNQGNVGIGTTSPTALLDVVGTASIGGQLTFRNTFGQIQTTVDQQLTLGGSTTGRILLSAFNGQTVSVGGTGSIVFGGYNNCTLKTDGSGNLQCQTDLTSGGGGYSPFQEITGVNGGVIAPNNSTEDLLIGGQSTASADFAVLGLASPLHQVTASVSGNLIVMANNGWGGQVGIGTTAPTAKLHVAGTTANDVARFDIGVDLNPVVYPTSPSISLVTSAGNVNAGQHYYYVTYYTALGETQLRTSSPISVTTDGTHAQIQITIPTSTDYRVIGRRIYRTTANSNYWENVKRVVNIADNTQTSYTDNIADASLTGTNYYYQDNSTSKYITVNNNPVLMISSLNTILGLGAGPNIFAGTAQSSSNVLIGGNAGQSLTTGAQIVAIGSGALQLLTTGNDNVAVGLSALQTLTTGAANVALGRNTGVGNQNGGNNTYIGYYAGYGGGSNNDNSYNTFVGNQSGQHITTGGDNSFLGNQSGFNNTVGKFNNAFGENALYNNTLGNNNSVFGWQSGYANTVGGLNTFLGYNANSNVGNLINAGAIGANAYVTQNDSLILGSINGINGATGSARIGIGTTTPTATLDIQGGDWGGRAALIVNQTGNSANDIFTASASGATRFRIAQNGSILIQGQIISSIGGGNTNTSSGAVVNAIGDQGSLVPNAGFESNLSGIGLSDGWYAAATNAATQVISRVATVSAKGLSSIQVKLNASQSTAFYSTCIPIAFQTGLGSYNISLYAKSSVANNVVVRGYLDTYSTQANCMSDTPTGRVISLGTVGTVNLNSTSWITLNQTAIAAPAATANTWAKVHIFVGCPASCTTGTVINVDAIRLIENSLIGGLDYAENYPGDPNNIPQAGDVVSLESSGSAVVVVPASKYMDDTAIGIVSTNPGQVLDDGSVPDPKVSVALAGRVPVKVSSKNGIIHIGDYLASSDIPGVAVKAITAGSAIGIAMGDYVDSDQSNIGSIMLFIKNTYYNGGSLASNTGLTSENRKDIVLPLTGSGSFIIRNSNGIASAVFDTNGNATFSGTFTLDKIKANQIAGLDIISNQIADLNTKVADIDARLAVLSASTTSSSLIPQLSTSSALTLTSFNVGGLATVSADLNVKGGGFFQGALNVLESITTQNLLVSQFAYFVNDVVFKGNVRFNQVPTFSKDTAGFAVIKKGEDTVQVTFDQEYNNTPIVTSSIVLDKVEDSVIQKQLEDGILNGNITYVITQRTTKGFVIRLNKPASQNLNFSWIALSVKDAKTSGFIPLSSITPGSTATPSAGVQSILNQLNGTTGNGGGQ